MTWLASSVGVVSGHGSHRSIELLGSAPEKPTAVNPNWIELELGSDVVIFDVGRTQLAFSVGVVSGQLLGSAPGKPIDLNWDKLELGSVRPPAEVKGDCAGADSGLM